MATLPLDVQNLLTELKPGDAGWQGAPEASAWSATYICASAMPAEAETWWNEQLGFDTMLNFGGSAVFLATGGYHHHVGANSWQSAGAKDRDPDRSGLVLRRVPLEDCDCREGGRGSVGQCRPDRSRRRLIARLNQKHPQIAGVS